MKVRAICTLAVMATLCLCVATQAQITSVGPPDAIQSSSNGGILDEVSLVNIDVTFDNADPAANIIEATLTGDINFTPQEGLFQAFYSLVTGFELTVGTVPVHLYNVELFADAKLVNGGGTLNDPLTDLIVSASLSQVNPDILINGVGVSKQIIGNGFKFLQESQVMWPYTLAAGQTYRFDLNIFLDVDTLNLFNDPVSVVSHEFGGQSSFDGYRLSILAAAVPEPASLALMALGLTMISRPRRPVHT